MTGDLKRHPPKLAKRLLRFMLRRSDYDAVAGDFEEAFDEHLRENGSKSAVLWYWVQVSQSIPNVMLNRMYWRNAMFKNYLKVTYRNLLKSKFYTLINLVGLAVGLTVFLFITIYTKHELSYNRFHDNHKNIFEIQIGEELSTSAALAPAVLAHLPDVKNICRVDLGYGGGRSPVLITETAGRNNKRKVKDFLYVDDNFFNLFSFELIHGDPSTALQNPYSMVLTRSLALQLFEKEDVVGEQIHFIGDRHNLPEMGMTVTAVVEDVPTNSTIKFNGLISFATLERIQPNGLPVEEDWRNWGYETYIQVNPQGRDAFEEKVTELWNQACLAQWPDDEPLSIGLVPLAETPFFNNNRRQFIYLIQVIGFFVLVIALINFINLTLARATTRAREVGIRKVVGSTKRDLIRQFLCESVLLTLIVTPFR